MEKTPIPKETPSRLGIYAGMALAAVAVLLALVFFAGFVIQEPVLKSSQNWTLVSYRDATGIQVPVIESGDITATFRNDGNITGLSGCNQYIAAYLINGKQIRITPPLHTSEMCSDAGIMAQESAYYTNLAKAATFQSGAVEMTVFDNDCRTLLVFHHK